MVVPAALWSEAVLWNFSDNIVNKNKGELEHKVHPATKFSLLKILNEKGPILPVPLARNCSLPNLCEKPTCNFFVEEKMPPPSSGEEEERERDVAEQHHAPNLPVLTAALIFLHAKFQHLAQKGEVENMHQFGTLWHRLHSHTKNKGEWIETGTHKPSFKPKKKQTSLSETFGPRVHVANAEQRKEIEAHCKAWQSEGQVARTKKKNCDECSEALDACSMDLQDFVQQLLHEPEENNVVLEAMSRHDSHFENFCGQNIWQGLKKHSRSTCRNCISMLMKGDDSSAIWLGMARSNKEGTDSGKNKDDQDTKPKATSKEKPPSKPKGRSKEKTCAVSQCHREGVVREGQEKKQTSIVGWHGRRSCQQAFDDW